MPFLLLNVADEELDELPILINSSAIVSAVPGTYPDGSPSVIINLNTGDAIAVDAEIKDFARTLDYIRLRGG